MARVGSVPNATASAVAAIKASERRLDTAAASVARQGAGLGPDTVSISPAARRAGAEAAPAAPASEQDLPGAMVDMSEARTGMKLGVAVLRTADELTQTLLNVVKRR